MVFFIPETYAPVLLKRRARAIRKSDPVANAQVVAPSELERQDWRQIMTVVLTRPLRMAATELIVSTTCCYLALCYAIFYMTFQAYPMIYQGIYGLSPGACGLVFLSIGAGALAAMPVWWWYDGFLRRAQARDEPWTHQEEYRRLPMACLGGPLFVISLFWLGWTAREDIHWAVPMVSGVPFGLGFIRMSILPSYTRPQTLANILIVIFMSLLNYITGKPPPQPPYSSLPQLYQLILTPQTPTRSSPPLPQPRHPPSAPSSAWFSRWPPSPCSSASASPAAAAS